MEFVCKKCSTRYSIAGEKLRGKVLKVRCVTCSTMLLLRRVRKTLSYPVQPPQEAALSINPASLKYGPGGDVSHGEPGPHAAAESEGAEKLQEGSPGEEDADDTNSWYLGLDGQQQGPMELTELRARIAQSPAASELLVWHSGLEDWMEPSEVPQLRGSADDSAFFWEDLNLELDFEGLMPRSAHAGGPAEPWPAGEEEPEQAPGANEPAADGSPVEQQTSVSELLPGNEEPPRMVPPPAPFAKHQTAPPASASEAPPVQAELSSANSRAAAQRKFPLPVLLGLAGLLVLALAGAAVWTLVLRDRPPVRPAPGLTTGPRKAGSKGGGVALAGTRPSARAGRSGASMHKLKKVIHAQPKQQQAATPGSPAAFGIEYIDPRIPADPQKRSALYTRLRTQVETTGKQVDRLDKYLEKNRGRIPGKKASILATHLAALKKQMEQKKELADKIEEAFPDSALQPEPAAGPGKI